MRARSTTVAVVLMAVACQVCACSAVADEFVFGFAGNGLTAVAKKPTADLSIGEFTMQLAAAGPAGA